MLFPKFWFCFKQSSIAWCYAGGRKTRTWSYLGILIAFRDWGMMFTFESDVFWFIDGETGRRESEVFLSFHMSDSILVLISSAHAHDVTIISLFSSFTIILDKRQMRVLRGFTWQPDRSDDVKSFTFNKDMLLRSCLFSVSRMLFDTLKLQHTVFSYFRCGKCRLQSTSAEMEGAQVSRTRSHYCVNWKWWKYYAVEFSLSIIKAKKYVANLQSIFRLSFPTNFNGHLW